MDCRTPGLPTSHHFLKLTQVHVHCISDVIQPSHPLTPSSPSALNLSQHQGHFQWIGCLHQMIKILDLHHHPSSEYSGLISLKTDWFDLLAVQGTLRSLLSTVVRRHQFFGALASLQSGSHNHMWPLRRPYLDYVDFVGRVMSLFFNTLSRFVIDFLPRNKGLLISWLQSHLQWF